MEFDKNHRWVKPFSTGMTCIDTINGECIRGLSKEDCFKVCQDSPFCDYGYHVQLPFQSQSYCVPLNNLAHWDNPSVFENSLFPPTQSNIFHPSLHVHISSFYTPTNRLEESLKNITQLNINLIKIQLSNEKNELQDYYLYPDLSFGTEIDDAVQIVCFKDYPIPSSISTANEIIRNGNVVFLKNHSLNRIILVIDQFDFGFMPYSLRVAASNTYDVSDVFHTQLVVDYPFDYRAITSNDYFAIRVAQIPIKDHFFYFDIDTTTKKLKLTKIQKTDMFNHSLDTFKRFNFEKVSQINIEEAENFLQSQQYYLLKNYQSKSSSSSISFLIILIILILFILFILFLFKFKRFNFFVGR